jgi:hypothetical protein
MTEWIERGPGQLASIEGSVRKFRTDGYHILPVNNGMGDGYGLLVWVDAHYVETRRLADPFNWYDIPGGLQARWAGHGHGQDYMLVREVRVKPVAGAST